MSEEYDEIEDPEMDEEIEDEWSDTDEEFEPSEFDEEPYQDSDGEFDPLDEKDISDELDQSDFEPFDPYDKFNSESDKRDIPDDNHTKATETKELDLKPPDKIPPDVPPPDVKPIIIPQQQPENKHTPEKQPKPPKSGENFWDKVGRGIDEFIKKFKEFFVKSDEDINKELAKKQYQKQKYEK
jgi:hypothetical protein